MATPKASLKDIREHVSRILWATVCKDSKGKEMDADVMRKVRDLSQSAMAHIEWLCISDPDLDTRDKISQHVVAVALMITVYWINEMCLVEDQMANDTARVESFLDSLLDGEPN